jgi:hypothetical protein
MDNPVRTMFPADGRRLTDSSDFLLIIRRSEYVIATKVEDFGQRVVAVAEWRLIFRSFMRIYL